MVKVKDIAAIMEKLAPKALAEPWDNVGLLLGRASAHITKVLLALDMTEETVAQAKAMGAGLIITHHPAIFKPLKELGEAVWQQELLLQLAEAGIAVYSSHTNLDCAPEGVNTVLAARLGLEQLQPLDSNNGLGRIGCLPKPMTLKDFAQQVKEALGAAYVAYANGGRPVERVAVCGGAGSDLWALALAQGADTLVTGDVKYHSAQEAAFSGLNIVDAGHQPTELPVLNKVKEYLEQEALLAGYSLEISIAKESLLLQYV